MRLKDKKTGNLLEAKVSRLQPEELDGLAQSEDFSFDWRLEAKQQK